MIAEQKITSLEVSEMVGKTTANYERYPHLY